MTETNLKRILKDIDAKNLAQMIVGNSACRYCIYSWGVCNNLHNVNCVDGIEAYLKSTNPKEHYLNKTTQEKAEELLDYIKTHKQEGTKTERNRAKRASELISRGS